MDQLIDEALNRSKLHGNMWALVFSGVLRSLQAISVTIDTQLLLGNVLGVASEDEFTCQTLISVVENLQSIYDLKMLHEQYSRLLRQGKDNAGRKLRFGAPKLSAQALTVIEILEKSLNFES